MAAKPARVLRGAVASTLLLLLSACGSGHSDNTPPTSPPSVSTAASGTLDQNGGVVNLAGTATATFPAGAAPASTHVSVEKVFNVTLDDTFLDTAGPMGIVDAADHSIRIQVGTAEIAKAVSVSLNVPDDLIPLLSNGRRLVLLTSGTDISDDADSGESHDVFDITQGTFDSQSSTFTAILPINAFSPANGNNGFIGALFRLAALPNDQVEGLQTAIAVKVLSNAKSNPYSCPGDQSWGAPMLFGYRAGRAVSEYYDPYAAGINAPFGEPRPQLKDGKTVFKTDGTPDMSSGHQGIDFFAEEGTPIFAVADGFIAQVKNENWNCKDKKHTAPFKKANQKSNPEISVTLALTDRVGNITDRVTYRHLRMGSAQELVPNADRDFATCWADSAKPGGTHTYPVEKGTLLGYTGATGMLNASTPVPPHLHFEWITSYSNASPHGNPLCKLTTNDPARAGFLFRNDDLVGQGADTRWLGGIDYVYAIYKIRRAKPAGTSNVCLWTTVPPCDPAGHGYFTALLSLPPAGFVWPAGSNGEIGYRVIEANDPRVGMMTVTQQVTGLNRNTPPSLNAESSYTLDGNALSKPPCNVQTPITLKLSLIADRFRTTRVDYGVESGILSTHRYPLQPESDGCERSTILQSGPQ
jgi:murein DD-endopeptidase MepM/ murein hydrolase activator NlpD